MMIFIKLKPWWKQFVCSHHWHTEKETERKIKSKHRVECKFRNTPEGKYVFINMGTWFIRTAYIRKCCYCYKRQIYYTWSYIFFDHKSRRNIIMEYPDIEDEPLTL